MTENHRIIWDWLGKNTELPETAIAGLMGNMECESSCEPCRLQGDFSGNRGRSAHYATLVDTGEMSEEAFRSDSLGWGLCQWTYFSRKAALLEWCRSRGCSIADMEGQLSFMVQEMQSDFAGMWKRLQSCTDLREAARLVCVEYEKPAVLNTQDRADWGQRFYESFAAGSSEDTAPDGSGAGGGHLFPQPSADSFPHGEALFHSIIELLEKILELLKTGSVKGESG